MLTIKLAYRNILRHRRRSALTLLSMGGACFLLSTMISMTEGSYSNLINLFTGDFTGHVQIHQGNYLQRPSLYKTIKNVNKIITELEKDALVMSVAPRIFAPSLAYGKDKTFPAKVIGIDPAREAATTHLRNKVHAGVYLNNGLTDSGYAPAMITYPLAKNLHISLGDELVLISQGIDGSIANDIFLITAIVGKTDSAEGMNIYISLNAMASFLSITSENEVHELAIKLKHQNLALTFAQQWQEKLTPRGLNVDPWQVVETAFYNGMQVDKKSNYVSLAVIIFIVSIGVLNTVLMGTLERTREFGVLKAIGTQPIAIFKLIMLESTFLALASCVAGMIFAMPLIWWLSQVGLTLAQPIEMGGVKFETMRAELNAFSFFTPIIVIILSTLLVSLYPAIRAARISPLQALQAV
ncbi:MAG: ABC transporter permease [Pseudomonadales bacterium]|nr:ABC transporter permease [Pseudomonadales bacterium]